MGFYCGLDLGARRTQVCVIDEEQETVVQQKVSNDLSRITGILGRYQPELEIVVESTFNWYWLVDGLREAGFSVQLAHVLGLSRITGARVKTDRRDARALAELLRLNAIPVAFIYPKETRSLRDLLRQRRRLTQRRGNERGSLRHLLYRYGWSDHGPDVLRRLRTPEIETFFPDPWVQLQVELALERIDAYGMQISAIEEAIAGHLSHQPAFARLQTIPGIGMILGATILLETGPIERFASARHYSSYSRVVPGEYQSGAVRRKRAPSKSKQGNPDLKWAFNQAAVQSVRHSPRIRLFFEQILARHAGTAGKLVAYNAVAHKLAIASFHVMKQDVVYQEELLFGS